MVQLKKSQTHFLIRRIIPTLTLPAWLGLLLALAVTIAYAAWNTPVTVDSTDNVGQFTSLAVVNVNPAISYLYNGIFFNSLRGGPYHVLECWP